MLTGRQTPNWPRWSRASSDIGCSCSPQTVGNDRERPRSDHPCEDKGMPCSLHLAWDEQLAGYDFGPGHPLAPVRVELTMALARAFGVLDGPGVSMITPEAASPDPLELIHAPVYLDAVRRAGDLAARGEPL